MKDTSKNLLIVGGIIMLLSILVIVIVLVVLVSNNKSDIGKGFYTTKCPKTSKYDGNTVCVQHGTSVMDACGGSFCSTGQNPEQCPTGTKNEGNLVCVNDGALRPQLIEACGGYK